MPEKKGTKKNRIVMVFFTGTGQAERLWDAKPEIAAARENTGSSR
jgi:hypothetical protein